MKNQKFLSLIGSFTKDEWVSYKKYSQLFYSSKSDLYKIMNYLQQNNHKLDLKNLSFEKLHKFVNPSITPKAFMNNIYNLNKYIEEFLIAEEIKNDKHKGQLLLLKSYSKRGLYKLSEKQKEKINKELASSTQDIWNGLSKIILNHHLYYSNLLNSIDEGKKALKNVIDSLNLFYSNLSNFYKVELVNRSVILKEQWETEIKQIDSNTFKKSPLNEIFNKLIKLKLEKSIDTYHELNDKLKKDFNTLSKEVKYTIAIHLISFLNHEIKKGSVNLGITLLQLYKYSIDKNILFLSGKISIRSFINILNTACVMNEIKWANSFLKNYAKYLGAKLESEITILGQAQISLTINNPENVITLLRVSKFNNFEIELRSKIILLFAQYDLNKENFYFLDSILKSTLYFINRNKNKVDKTTSMGFKNLIKFFHKIISGNAKEKILEQLNQEKIIISKTWLKNRIELLD